MHHDPTVQLYSTTRTSTQKKLAGVTHIRFCFQNVYSHNNSHIGQRMWSHHHRDYNRGDAREPRLQLRRYLQLMVRGKNGRKKKRKICCCVEEE